VKQPTPVPTTPALSLKRLAPGDEDDEVIEQPAKRQKTDGVARYGLVSPSKKQMLEDDGIVMLEGDDEDRLKDDVDVIVID